LGDKENTSTPSCFRSFALHLAAGPAAGADAGKTATATRAAAIKLVRDGRLLVVAVR
jgi:hypothetical protein